MSKHLHILLVEDNEGDHLLFKEIANSLDINHTLTWAIDGEEAITFLENSDITPNAIFLDINMPRMNGHEFMESYGDKIAEAKIPVYVLTSSNYEKDRVLFSPYKSILGYLMKSASFDELSQIMSDLVEVCDAN